MTINTKLCDRCLEEYPKEEFTKIMDNMYICYPCRYDYIIKFTDFLNDWLYNKTGKDEH